MISKVNFIRYFRVFSGIQDLLKALHCIAEDGLEAETRWLF